MSKLNENTNDNSIVIFNFTQHEFTKEQRDSHFCVNMGPEVNDWVKEQLTFSGEITQELLQNRAMDLANYAEYIAMAFCEDVGSNLKDIHILIGGAPYFMPYLEKALISKGLTPIYSFSERVSEEVKQEDGTIKKVSSFKHKYFIPANPGLYEGY